MQCPSTNQGPTTFTYRFGAKSAKDPANKISVNQSLHESHEGLEGLIRPGDWV